MIIIFIDGVGVGELEPSFNPCFFSETGIFNSPGPELPESGRRYALETQLGVKGLPQSATGHTTIYTGANAAALIQKHLYGYPNQELRNELQEKSLFVRLTRQGYSCKFMNAFRPIFFTTPELFRNKHMSATTEMNRYADLEFAEIWDIRNNRALYHDYTNRELIIKGFDLPLFTATRAAEVLAAQSKLHDVILFEYFLTDFAGHARDMAQAIHEIHKMEKLILEVLDKTDRSNTSLFVISDHGNIEDLRTKSHTNNPAYCGLWTADSIELNSAPTSLLDVYPLMVSLIDAHRSGS